MPESNAEWKEELLQPETECRPFHQIMKIQNWK
jgi:hypothetical protein